MKKRAAFIVIFALFAAFTIPAAAANVTEISSAEDMLMLRECPDGIFRLTNDINMSSLEWVPVPFSGTLYGDGHTLYNLCITAPGTDTFPTVDGNDLIYSDTVFAALFSSLSGEIRDLRICGADISLETDMNCYAAAFAGNLDHGIIENCTVEETRISLRCACAEGLDNGIKKTCVAGIGGLVGFGSGDVLGCRAEVTLCFADESAPDLFCEQFMGGFLANGNVRIEDCSVSLRGYDACRGYAHNGGLVGMFYCFDKNESPRPVSGCTSDGFIRFFEDNTDRRAYCAPFIGENLSYTEVNGCSESFTRDEVFDYALSLSPEICAFPALREEIVSPGCTAWGYTEHRCEGCGNTWRDSFTPCAHTPGTPHLTEAPDYGKDGTEAVYCTVCGALISEQRLPALIPTAELRISERALSLHYKDHYLLTAELVPADATEPGIIWTSSDENIVTIDENGALQAVGRGNAVITCASADGFAKAECNISVDYSPLQWLIKIFLFGWIWYK